MECEGNKEKRLAIRQTFQLHSPDFICIQETKMSNIDVLVKNEVCGRRYDGFRTIDAQGIRGGLLLTWPLAKFEQLESLQGNYCLTLRLKNLQDNTIYTVTGVYGPSTNHGRSVFFDELKQAKQQDATPWLLYGDFNLTMLADDRTDNTNDWRQTVRFSRLTQVLGLINLPLQGRGFTWSNERSNPHLARLDRFLVSDEWCANLQMENRWLSKIHPPIIAR